MPDITLPVDVAVGDPVKSSPFNTMKDAVSDVNAALSLFEALGVANGSMEFDENVAGTPDAWTPSVSGAASWSLTDTTVDVHHGKQSFAATTTVASGDTVNLLSNEFIPCAPGQRINVPFYVKNASGIKVTINVLMYQWVASAWSLVSTQVGYTGSETLASFAKRLKTVVASSTAEAYKVQMVIGGVGETTAGTVYVDGLESYIYRGHVPLTRTSKSSGTVTLSLDDALEHPIAGWFTVTFVESDAGVASLTISGTDQLTGNSITVYAYSRTAGLRLVDPITLRVPVDVSNQCSFAWNDGGGAGGSITIYQNGYEV